MMKDFFDPGIQPIAFNCQWLRTSYNNWNFTSLFANYWRLWWNSASGAVIRCGSQSEPLVPENLYVVHPNVDVETRHDGDCFQLYIHFTVLHPLRLLGPPIAVVPMTDAQGEWVRKMIALFQQDNVHHYVLSMHVHAFVESVLADLTERHLSFRGVDSRLLNALRYMDQHLARTISNASLAHWVHLHPQSLLRLFKKELGLSPQAYLKRLRVDKACWMLQMTDDSIDSIAEAAGFCDRYHMSKVFAQVMGKTPARFREASSAAGFDRRNDNAE